jgi:cyclase
LTPVALLFEHSLTLQGSKRRAVLMAKGCGHTTCDSILYLPEEEIVFMGDLLSVNTHPHIRDGNTQEWVRILEEIETLALRDAVPGHGPVGGKENLTVFREYLTMLLDHAVRLATAKIPPETIQHSEIPERYAEWQVPSLYANNLKHLCEQFSAAERC